MTTGRNEPCPCGSGRKYKHCCLREGESKRTAPSDSGVALAIAWVEQRFRRQVAAAISEGFFGGFGPELVSEALEDLGEGHLGMTQINIGDYILNEAIYERGDEEGRGIDWVLDGGPRLGDAQRAFLEALADAPLRLYEVLAVRPGEGVELRDAIDPSRSPSFVSERSASMTLCPGDMVGTRVLRFPDRNELGGALYPLDRTVASEVIERVERTMNGDFDDEDEDGTGPGPDRPLDPELEAIIAEELAREDTPEEEAEDAAIAAQIEDEHVAPTIREAWLLSLIAPRVPDIVDTASGAPVMLIEDDYDVSDPAALAAALSACRDVAGDARQGWTRLEDPQADVSRTLTAINPTGSPDLVTLFHRTQAGAEAGREWFQRVAGSAVRPRARRVVDPRDAILERSGRDETPGPESGEDLALEPDDLGALFEQVIRRTYANWCDEPIPALGDKTPRQCLVDARGRERVRYLLKTYEHGERRQAADQRRAPVSYEFLWQALGLAREE